MDKKYIFDTSFWIWMKNIAYPMGIFPAVWRYFIKMEIKFKFATATL